MELEILDKDKFIDFLETISYVSDVCVLNIEKGSNSWCIVQSPCSTYMLYLSTTGISSHVDVKLNIPDVRRLIWSLQHVNVDESAKLEVLSQGSLMSKGAIIKYNSTSIRFTYHLLSNDRVSVPRANPETVKAFEGKCKFTIMPNRLKDTVKAQSFTTGSKLYFFTDEENVKVSLGDKHQSCIDDVTLILSNEFEGDAVQEHIAKPLAISAIQSITQTSPIEILASIDMPKNIVVFNIKTKYNSAKFILTPLVM